MKQSVNDLKPGMMMLIIKNENGTFSPVYMDEYQCDFLDRCLATLSHENVHGGIESILFHAQR